MKPHEARARRQAREMEKVARGEKLEAYLTCGGDMEKVVPELIPTDRDRTEAFRAYRRAARLAAGETAGTGKSQRLLDRTMIALAHIVVIERVLALDPLERAALTPARLVQLSVISPADLRRRLAAFQGESEIEVMAR